MSIKPHTDRRGRKVWIADLRDRTGARRRFIVETKAEYDRILAAVDAGTYVHASAAGGAVTLADYITNTILPGPKTTDHHRWAAKALIALIGDVPLDNLSGGDALRFEELRRARGAKDSTIRKEAGFLRAVAKRAFQEGRISHEDFDRIRFVDLPTEGRVPPVYHDDEQRRRLLARCRPWLARIVTFAYLTGWDKSEILGLDWSMIPAGMSLIDCPRAKTGQPRILPLTPTLRGILDEAAGGTRPLSGRVFRGDKGAPADDWSARTALLLAYRKAGLSQERPWKSFRHTFRVLAVRAGVPETIQAALMGHAPKTMTQAYGDVTRLADVLRAALLAIEGQFGQRSGSSADASS